MSLLRDYLERHPMMVHAARLWKQPTTTAQFVRQVLSDPAVEQDHEDGAALRRLREALPENGWLELYVDVSVYGSGVLVKTEGYRALAATIAEAADECREALAGPLSGTLTEDTPAP